MHSRESGQSLIELVIVITVIVIVVGALTFATIASLRNSTFSQNQAQATKLAQEGLERVRLGRDRNQCIVNLRIASWNSNNTSCPGDAFWTYRIYSECGTTELTPNCYFKISADGVLTHLTAAASYPAGNVEQIGLFKRFLIISDYAATFDKQKTVTAIVTWTDFSGAHESKLTTILGKIER